MRCLNAWLWSTISNSGCGLWPSKLISARDGLILKNKIFIIISHILFIALKNITHSPSYEQSKNRTSITNLLQHVHLHVTMYPLAMISYTIVFTPMYFTQSARGHHWSLLNCTCYLYEMNTVAMVTWHILASTPSSKTLIFRLSNCSNVKVNDSSWNKSLAWIVLESQKYTI